MVSWFKYIMSTSSLIHISEGGGNESMYIPASFFHYVRIRECEIIEEGHFSGSKQL